MEGRRRTAGLPPIVHTARKLRQTMSLPEVMLWGELRKRPGGLKFRRQHAIGDYVLDFYCAAARLAVEVGGWLHDGAEHVAYDARRDAWLEDRGVRCIRLPARAVLADPAAVAMAIVAAAGECPVAPPLHQPSAGPPPRSGEEFQEGPWNT